MRKEEQWGTYRPRARHEESGEVCFITEVLYVDFETWLRWRMKEAVVLSLRGQSGLEAKILASASASRFWHRPGLDLVVLLCNRAFLCKNRVKFGNFIIFSGNNLKSYVVNHYLVLFHNYFCRQLRPRPRPRPHSPGLGLGVGFGLGIVALASASASRFWPRLTSLEGGWSWTKIAWIEVAEWCWHCGDNGDLTVLTV